MVKLHPELSVRYQCELLGVNRSSLYSEPVGETAFNLTLMKLIDEKHTKHPFTGKRKMVEHLARKGYEVNVKRVQRLMRILGIRTIYPKKNLSKPHPDHRVYPYLLNGVVVDRANQVWSADITYIRMRHGFLYLVAIIDWFSRYVLSWRLSNTLDTCFCIEALDEALENFGPCEIFNSDQGCQFTSNLFTDRLLEKGIRISMDGKGRAFDNIFVERLWRTVKYEEVYLHDYEDGRDAKNRLTVYLAFYNGERLHQSLGYQTPAEVYFAGR
jgi:putative transposase